MTFRARLTLFFLGIVAVPLLAGAFLADHLSRSQAVRDADARLEVASVAAADGFRQERIAVGHALSSTVAVRAFRAARLADLDRLRRASRLDYLLVMRRGRPTRDERLASDLCRNQGRPCVCDDRCRERRERMDSSAGVLGPEQFSDLRYRN